MENNNCITIGDKLYMLISSVGVTTNLFAIVIFYILINTQKNLQCLKYAKYLLAKSIFDFYYLFFLLLNPIFLCTDCHFTYEYSFIVFQIITKYYLGFTCGLCSILCEIFASIDRYITLCGNSKIYKKIPFYTFMILICVFGFSFYSYKFFEYSISPVLVGNETLYFFKELTENKIFTILAFFHSFIRDLLCVLVQIVLDILIVRKFKKLISQKKKFYSINGVNKRGELNRISIKRNHEMEKKENSKTQMIILINLVSIIGHFPIFVHYILNLFRDKEISETGCDRIIVENLFFFSKSINFFFYLAFDLNFKNVTKSFFSKLKCQNTCN